MGNANRLRRIGWHIGSLTAAVILPSLFCGEILADDTYYEVWRSSTLDINSAAPIRSAWDRLKATGYVDTTAPAGVPQYYWVRAVTMRESTATLSTEQDIFSGSTLKLCYPTQALWYASSPPANGSAKLPVFAEVSARTVEPYYSISAKIFESDGFLLGRDEKAILASRSESGFVNAVDSWFCRAHVDLWGVEQATLPNADTNVEVWGEVKFTKSGVVRTLSAPKESTSPNWHDVPTVTVLSKGPSFTQCQVKQDGVYLSWDNKDGQTTNFSPTTSPANNLSGLTWYTNPDNGHTYALTSGTNWASAEAVAQSYGGHLATIRNAEENTWLFETFGTWVWIGLSDEVLEGNYVWSSGESVTYTNWHPANGTVAQPDDRLPGSDYVHFGDYGAGADKWANRADDGIITHGIIEVVPEPTSLTVLLFVGGLTLLRRRRRS